MVSQNHETAVDYLIQQVLNEATPTLKLAERLLDEQILVVHFPSPAGEAPTQAAVAPSDEGDLLLAFTSPAHAAESKFAHGDFMLVNVRLREFLEGTPPDVGLLLNHGCALSCVIHWTFLQDALPSFGSRVVAQEPTDAWLSAVNQQLAEKDIPPERRPWEAFSELEKVTGFPLSLSSARANRIYRWFEHNTKPGAHLMGPFMAFAYYFDASFWPSPMPLLYGEQSVDPYASLNMPEQILQRLLSSEAEAVAYAVFWGECYDYAYGTDDMLRSGTTDYAKHVIAAARDQVAVATSLLLEHKPNVRALEASGLGTELLLKAFLGVKDALDDEYARKHYRHGIPDLIVRCAEIAPASRFAAIGAHAAIFPPMSDRYKEVERTRRELWRAYALVVHIGAVVMRQLTERDISQHLQCVIAPPQF